MELINPMLVPELVRIFGSPPELIAWVAVHFPAESPYNIIPVGPFSVQITQLLVWAKTNDKGDELIQKLVDDPAKADLTFLVVINLLSCGTIRPTNKSGPPIEAHKDWFAAERPFVNRRNLRTLLENLDGENPGPKNIVIIVGDRFTGKSHSLRFVAHCAPKDRLAPINLRDWQDVNVMMNVKDLASAIAPNEQNFPSFDPTKESEAAPRIWEWLKRSLAGSRRWIIMDHFEEASLTPPARWLLLKVADQIANGLLPGIKFVLSGLEPAKLPVVGIMQRCDTAVLFDEKELADWCVTFSAHLGKPLSKERALELSKKEVFDNLPADIKPFERGALLEERILLNLVPKIRQL